MPQTLPHDSLPQTGAPRLVRRIGLGLVAMLLGGAGYLIAVRGEAIVVDLATLGNMAWCF